MTPSSQARHEDPQARNSSGVTKNPAALPQLYLTPYDSLYASVIVSWVQTEQVLTWLAPGTPPPLTVQKVAAWGENAGRRFLFWQEGIDSPAGYAELNPMPNRPAQLWIGHFIIDPACRGRSYGSRFTRVLLAQAFWSYSAMDVLLVVFPENKQAVRCYERAGMVPMGYERKHFPATGREHLFLQMGINISRFQSLAALGQVPSNAPEIRAKPG